MKLIAINVTLVKTWVTFSAVTQTENVSIKFICLLVNVCKFVLCMATLKLECLIILYRKLFI